MSAKAETAEQMIRRVLTDCLPTGVPPSFRNIVNARFVGSGRKRKSVGLLEMFDGQPATAEAFIGGEALGIKFWGHCWTDMPGGACSFENGEWVRCDDEGNIIPKQMSLPLAVVQP